MDAQWGSSSRKRKMTRAAPSAHGGVQKSTTPTLVQHASELTFFSSYSQSWKPVLGTPCYMRICRSSEPVSLFALSLYRQWYFIIHSRVSHMLHLPSGGGEIAIIWWGKIWNNCIEMPLENFQQGSWSCKLDENKSNWKWLGHWGLGLKQNSGDKADQISWI